ncbi:hypothetical protein [Dyadobacter psychrotolerans]|uniref:Uncharacterized protein n=1 Tax=Dyadobacter psychrotolerans TaxID=2541721 RepID=A0A4R5DMR0_9BACT|nr:hypothetical protein [Dyadobacter psychrotolerans]TDE14807.1 hypothetical protein E0F88_16620 [Dyadobacter psychrotolerans]
MKDINKEKLNKALTGLNTYEPGECIWLQINDGLNELPLQDAIRKLSDYEPDDLIWTLIEKESVAGKKKQAVIWYAAATVLLASFFGLWLLLPAQSPDIAFSQQEIDSRLQTTGNLATDEQFNTLKTYCETETLVCNRRDFRQLTHDYEALRFAARELQQAIGNYNTEPDLMRQLSVLEQEKADILNKMAKMI